MGIFSAVKRSIGINRRESNEIKDEWTQTGWEIINFDELPSSIQDMQMRKERWGVWFHTNDPVVFDILAGTDELRAKAFAFREELLIYDGLVYSNSKAPEFRDFEYLVNWIHAENWKGFLAYKRPRINNRRSSISYDELETHMKACYDALMEQCENFLFGSQMGEPTMIIDEWENAEDEECSMQ